MKKYSPLESRLEQLEGRIGGADAVLTFVDGSTRAIWIPIKNRLEIFCDACRRITATYGYPGNQEHGPIPPHKAATVSDRYINLLASAVSIQSDDPFLNSLLFGLSKLAVTMESEFEETQTAI